jgi:hypothetical protein
VLIRVAAGGRANYFGPLEAVLPYCHLQLLRLPFVRFDLATASSRLQRLQSLQQRCVLQREDALEPGVCPVEFGHVGGRYLWEQFRKLSDVDRIRPPENESEDDKVGALKSAAERHRTLGRLLRLPPLFFAFEVEEQDVRDVAERIFGGLVMLRFPRSKRNADKSKGLFTRPRERHCRRRHLPLTAKRLGWDV